MLGVCGLGSSGFFGVEELDPGAHEVAIIVISATADEVAVDDAGLVDKDSAADFEIESAFGDSGHFSAPNAISEGGDFDSVADTGDGQAFLEEKSGHSDQVLVIADIFGGASTTEENPQVIGRVDVPEGDVGLDGIPFPLFGDCPTWFDFMHDHLVAVDFRCGHDGFETSFNESVIGIEGVDRFRSVANNDQNLVRFFIFHRSNGYPEMRFHKSKCLW